LNKDHSYSSIDMRIPFTVLDNYFQNVSCLSFYECPLQLFLCLL